MTRGRGALIVLTATSLLLAGCTGDDEPEKPATPSTAASSPSETSPTSEPSPSEPPPTLPPEAQAQDIYGAAAFIRFYFDTMNYAFRTGDVGVASATRAADCAACENLESEVSDVYERGGSIVGGEAEIGDVVVTPGDFSSGAEALAVLTTASGDYLDPAGEVTDTSEASTDMALTVLLNWADSRWQMAEWGARSGS